ncbi:hypothetical protein CDL24_11505 [Mediterraneibacter gnavus]|nr:hypothetical protein CDL24_11505 [Mediterraneibacter gnavus]
MGERYLPPPLPKVKIVYHLAVKKARERRCDLKTGRPLKGKTKLSYDVKVRLDDETYKKLCQYCERTGKEKASVLREGLRNFLGISED